LTGLLSLASGSSDGHWYIAHFYNTMTTRLIATQAFYFAGRYILLAALIGIVIALDTTR
jgi:hypothetical protein